MSFTKPTTGNPISPSNLNGLVQGISTYQNKYDTGTQTVFIYHPVGEAAVTLFSTIDSMTVGTENMLVQRKAVTSALAGKADLNNANQTITANKVYGAVFN